MTKREAAEEAVLDVIKSYENKPYGASIRDIATRSGLGTGTVHEIIVSLGAQKRITYTPKIARSVRLVKENNGS